MRMRGCPETLARRASPARKIVAIVACNSRPRKKNLFQCTVIPRRIRAKNQEFGCACSSGETPTIMGRRWSAVFLSIMLPGTSLLLHGATAAEANDLYFPAELLGSWQIESRDAESNGRKDKPPVFYAARFVEAPRQLAGGDDATAVLDRRFTTTTLLEAEVGPGSVREITFDLKRPDYLFFRLRGGLGAESRVLRREQFYAAPGELHTVELMLQTVDNTKDVDGPPTRTLAQNETVYEFGGGVEALRRSGRFKARQIISMFPVPQELGGRPQQNATPQNGAGLLSSLLGQVEGLLTQRPTSVYRFDLTFTKNS